MRVEILYGILGSNLGDLCLYQTLESALLKMGVRVQSHEPFHPKEMLGYGPAYDPAGWARLVDEAMKSPSADRIRAADAVIGVGGGRIHSFFMGKDYDSSGSVFVLSEFLLAKALNKPMMLVSQTLAPLIENHVQPVLDAVGRAKSFCCRDPYSYTVAQRIGLPAVRVNDMAFLTRPDVIPSKAIDLGISLRDDRIIAYNEPNHPGLDWVRALKMHYSMMFVTSEPGMDKNMPYRLGLATMKQEFSDTPGQSWLSFLANVGACRVIISDRLHTLIAAAIMGVPFIPIHAEGTLKNEGLVASLGYPVPCMMPYEHYSRLLWLVEDLMQNKFPLGGYDYGAAVRIAQRYAQVNVDEIAKFLEGVLT